MEASTLVPYPCIAIYCSWGIRILYCRQDYNDPHPLRFPYRLLYNESQRKVAPAKGTEDNAYRWRSDWLHQWYARNLRTIEKCRLAYIVSEATAAAAMHIVKAVTYGKFDLMNWHIFLNGFFIGCAMMAGNFIALHLIKHARKKAYQRVVACVMIAVSVWLFIQV